MQDQNSILSKQARCVSHEIRNHLSVSDLYCEIIAKHLEKNGISIPAVDNALNCIKKSILYIGYLFVQYGIFNVPCSIINIFATHLRKLL